MKNKDKRERTCSNCEFNDEGECYTENTPEDCPMYPNPHPSGKGEIDDKSIACTHTSNNSSKNEGEDKKGIITREQLFRYEDCLNDWKCANELGQEDVMEDFYYRHHSDKFYPASYVEEQLNQLREEAAHSLGKYQQLKKDVEEHYVRKEEINNNWNILKKELIKWNGKSRTQTEIFNYFEIVLGLKGD